MGSETTNKTKTGITPPEPQQDRTSSGLILPERSGGLRVHLIQQLSGEGLGRVIEIRPGMNFKIGRDPSCQWIVREDSCSRMHALILFPENSENVFVRDLGSSNGSELGPQKLVIGTDTVWTPGQVLTLGGQTRFQLISLPAEDAAALLAFANNPDKDPPTGALSRKSFLEALQRECDHLYRHPDQEVALLILRVFNNAEESVIQHANRNLKTWMTALKSTIRAGTTPGRVSDFELGFILRRCDVGGAQSAAKRYWGVVQAAHSSLKSSAEHSRLLMPALGGVIFNGKQNPSAQEIIQFISKSLFKTGLDITRLDLKEFVPSKRN